MVQNAGGRSDYTPRAAICGDDDGSDAGGDGGNRAPCHASSMALDRSLGSSGAVARTRWRAARLLQRRRR